MMKLIFFIFSISAMATTFSNQSIFQATFEACSKIDFMSRGPAFDKFNAGIFPSTAFNQLIGEVSQQSFKNALFSFQYMQESNEMTVILNNTGFHTALKKCYGNNSSSINYFINAVKKNDRAGKTIAAILTYFNYKSSLFFLGKFAHIIGASYIAISIRDYFASLNAKKDNERTCKKMGFEGITGACLTANLNISNSDEGLKKEAEADMLEIQQKIKLTSNQNEKARLQLILQQYQSIYSGL